MSRLQNASVVSLIHFQPMKLEKLCKDGHHIMITTYLSRYRWVYDTLRSLLIPISLAWVTTCQNAYTVVNTSILAS